MLTVLIINLDLLYAVLDLLYVYSYKYKKIYYMLIYYMLFQLSLLRISAIHVQWIIHILLFVE